MAKISFIILPFSSTHPYQIPQGVPELQGFLKKKGHEISANPKDADLLAYSIYTKQQYSQLLKLLRTDSKKNIIVGGPYFRNCDEEKIKTVLGFTEAVIYGDGEPFFEKYFKEKNLAKIPNAYFLRPDELIKTEEKKYDGPIVYDFTGLEVLMKSSVPSVTISKGCKNACGFCSDGGKRRFQKRPIKEIMGGIEAIKKTGHKGLIFFGCSAINHDLKFLESLCDKIKKSRMRIKWHSFACPGKIPDHLIKKMTESGCTRIGFGMETASQSLMKEVGKLYDKEIFSNTIRKLSENGIEVKLNVIFFLPGESKEDIKETSMFIGDNARSISIINCYDFYPVKGSVFQDCLPAGSRILNLLRFLKIKRIGKKHGFQVRYSSFNDHTFTNRIFKRFLGF